jgi:hypothetical protein
VSHVEVDALKLGPTGFLYFKIQSFLTVVQSRAACEPGVILKCVSTRTGLSACVFLAVSIEYKYIPRPSTQRQILRAWSLGSSRAREEKEVPVPDEVDSPTTTNKSLLAIAIDYTI